jgi:hypothetical protein
MPSQARTLVTAAEDEGWPKGDAMSQSTTQFITQMKLRELHRQRIKLREAYRHLGEEVAETREPADRLRRLCDGLRGLNFAGQPLHPEVVNLEILRYEAEAGTIAPDVLVLGLQRLEEELEAGRSRSEFVYLFGALLEEWARETSADGHLRAEGRQVRGRLLRAALADLAPDRHREILDPLFASLGPALAEFAARLQEKCREGLRTSVTEGELSQVLEQLAADIYRPPRLRREARQFAANDQLRKELADALTILNAELHTWDWPADGLATRALWTRNKWRLYLDEDLPTACLLEIVGGRWVGILEGLIGDQSVIDDRRARIKKLIELKAPEVILENERRMLRQAEQIVELGLSEAADAWEAGAVGPDSGATGRPAATPERGSVIQARASHQRSLRSLHLGRDYEGESGAVNQAVVLVNAEVQLARATFPDRPLYVVKADIQDYYPSIPHDVLLTLLHRLGTPESDLGFFARFLAPPLRDGDRPPTRMRRGVPMGHTLSALFAELLMRLLERDMRLHARVRIVRLVDDICLLTPDPEAAQAAWARVVGFCAPCGLRVNEPKSGAVCIGGTLPEGLPCGRPRWGMLELDERGQWHVHGETFETHRVQSRARVVAARSLLSRVQQYNADATYLINALALGGALGDAHRESAGRAIRSFHHDFFGDDQGIVAGLCVAIRERLLPDAGEPAAIPEGWVYWPITAGGLGLKNPLVVAGQYSEADRKREPVVIPEAHPTVGWDLHANEWGKYYGHLLEPIPPIEPDETKVMKALVDDFIQRGQEISAGRQRGLTSHWRWIPCTYGPQILHRFGTFRFLITELVPLQLISRQLVRDSSLSDAGQPPEAGKPGEGEIPF